MIICPSAPMLKRPALNAKEIPNAAKTKGVAAVKVSEIAFSEPNDPIKRLVKATNIFSKVSPVASRNKQPIIKAKKVAKTAAKKGTTQLQTKKPTTGGLKGITTKQGVSTGGGSTGGGGGTYGG